MKQFKIAGYSRMKNSSVWPGIGLSCKYNVDYFVIFFCETDEYKPTYGFGCGQYLRRIKPFITFHCPVQTKTWRFYVIKRIDKALSMFAPDSMAINACSIVLLLFLYE